jgi:hypothetical protein
VRYEVEPRGNLLCPVKKTFAVFDSILCFLAFGVLIRSPNAQEQPEKGGPKIVLKNPDRGIFGKRWGVWRVSGDTNQDRPNFWRFSPMKFRCFRSKLLDKSHEKKCT